MEAIELTMAAPRYPQIRVATESHNPLALVAAVRQALRQARVDRNEIRRFSSEALASSDPHETQEICSDWVRIASTQH